MDATVKNFMDLVKEQIRKVAKGSKRRMKKATDPNEKAKWKAIYEEFAELEKKY